MSVPFAIFYCEECAYLQSSLLLVGGFVYQDKTGAESHLDRAIGWCYSCNQIQAVEQLPTNDSIAKRRILLRRKIDELTPGPIGRLFIRISEGVRGRSLRWAHEDLAKLGVLEKVRLLNRKPCCLKCGATDVEIIQRAGFSVSQRERYDVSLGFNHPGCGGLIREKDSNGVRVAPHIMKRTYSIGGKLIKEREANKVRE